MKIILLVAAVLLAPALPAWSQEAKAPDLPPGCTALIADARACIPKGTADDVRVRINHVLDMMADNVRHADRSERMELCQTTITSYRQMADLVCSP
ncbi:MAG TPA: hypothetical protein VHX86_16840 [Tepidisphaeraceae bacterium]|jgi:hypothetical protein|nr:hypothetical protein [Tepidisphaeraceae bacterium]